MKLPLLFLALLAISAVQAVRFRSALHTIQLFTRDLYPSSPTQQKRATITLRYLFRRPAWSQREHWPYLDHFLRTGGLNSGFLTRDTVLVDDAILHLAPGSLLQHHVYLRPSVDRLIEMHYRKAKRGGWAERWDRVTPDLGWVRNVGRGDFEGVPEPMTVEEAEEMVGEGWRRGVKDEQGTVRGDRPFFGSHQHSLGSADGSE
ncbi:hypothetical protein PSEUBRA_005407 [Kalmanozyma brasiliensis GHG001]|uniref:uncharacterized protein n=1 Tax=Kalmanozyma brasiliensis (strain GHG001) TaxID=1365824 RepID=UPI002867E2AB|nr:uncharacterized protein PSEUBRA_005407 [Kalmanozyma brasiliensis GHG001]KAF6767519.1 hypothetical protein PSEUBRA_005407 [Kalmanozyma brasiliensis GHG001]